MVFVLGRCLSSCFSLCGVFVCFVGVCVGVGVCVLVFCLCGVLVCVGVCVLVGV